MYRKLYFLPFVMLLVASCQQAPVPLGGTDDRYRPSQHAGSYPLTRQPLLGQQVITQRDNGQGQERFGGFGGGQYSQMQPLPERTQPRGFNFFNGFSSGEKVKVAFLVPLSGKFKSLGEAMLNSAKLAVFFLDEPNLDIMPIDTKGTPFGAKAAAEEAISRGAKIILGPVFSRSAKSAITATEGSDVHIISFSNDKTLADTGVFTIGFRPEQEINRVVSYALNAGILDFTTVLPNNGYGAAAAETLRVALADVTLTKKRRIVESDPNAPEVIEGEVPATENTPKDGANAQLMEFEQASLLGELSGFNEEGEQFEEVEVTPSILRSEIYYVDAKGKARNLYRHTINSMNAALNSRAERDYIEEEKRFNDDPIVYPRGMLVPEGGVRLKQILANLERSGRFDSEKVRLLGSALWAENLPNHALLEGSWFAAADVNKHQAFEAHYQSIYGKRPPSIASLAYDGVALSVALSRMSRGNDFSREAITNPRGFVGVDGIFRLEPNGLTTRGLAVMEVQNGQPVVIDPAPTRFSNMGG